MPTADDLCGFGIPAQAAELLGSNPSLVNGVGTAQTGAAAIRTPLVELVATGGQTTAILPANAKIGVEYYIFCSSSTSGVVYVPSGHTLNGTLNGSITIAQNKSTTMVQYKNKFWLAPAAA